MSDIDDCSKSVERLTRDRGEVMRAADDRIEKIRAHHAEAEIALRGTGRLRKVHPHDAPEWAMDAHDHRATLLAEVERLTRERDEARAEVRRMRELLVTIQRLNSERDVALSRERDEARAEVERLREVIRTIRARCVEMDDSDAVSETLDISSAALEDEP